MPKKKRTGGFTKNSNWSNDRRVMIPKVVNAIMETYPTFDSVKIPRQTSTNESQRLYKSLHIDPESNKHKMYKLYKNNKLDVLLKDVVCD